MASSRKSKRSDEREFDLVRHVRERLRKVVRPSERLVIGLSGGVDSIVLLDVVSRIAKRARFELAAVHVNHQLSPNAAAWARFCRSACGSRGITCRVVKVSVAHGNSVERAARDARYAALERSACDYVVLAHNSDDQAETVLLQLLRGAGVRGLSAMSFVRPFHRQDQRTRSAIDRAVRPRALLRPLLDVSRAEIERYAKRRRLTWIADESNANVAFLRNWLRHELAPRIAERVPAWRAVLTRTAAHMAEASILLDELAVADAAQAVSGNSVRVSCLRALSAARAKNVLRWFVARNGLLMPDAASLDEALRQAVAAAPDARVAVSVGTHALRRYRDTLYLVRDGVSSDSGACIVWQGEGKLALPNGRGVLEMTERTGEGLSAKRLSAEPVTIRCRTGGEKLASSACGPRRTVKNLLQEAGVPAWQRERLPFIYCGDTLVCIPGIAIDHRYRAARGEAGVVPRWRGATEPGKAS